MSAALATAPAGSSRKSVSVVPIQLYPSQGMTKKSRPSIRDVRTAALCADRRSRDMDALGRADEGARMRAEPCGHAVEPRTGCIHDDPGANLGFITAKDVANPQAGQRAFAVQAMRDLGVVQRHRAMLHGVDDVLQAEPLGRVHLGVEVDGRALQSARAQLRLLAAHFRSAQEAMVREAFAVAERVVEQHPRAQPGAMEEAGVVKWDEKLQRFEEVRGDAQQRFTLAQVHAHEGEIQHLEVAQAAMNQTCGARGGCAAEIGFFEQGDTETPQRGVAGNAGADDAAAGDRDVELPFEFAQTSHLYRQVNYRPATVLCQYGFLRRVTDDNV